MAPGNYALTVTHPGFRTFRQILDVNLGPPGTLNVRLAVVGASTTVKVTDEVPLIHAENGDAFSIVTGLQGSQVPNPGNDLT